MAMITYPNRETTKAIRTKSFIVGLLLATIFLVSVITVGGWRVRSGSWPAQALLIVFYGVFATRVYKWRHGILPVIASIAIFTATFAMIATPSWFERDSTGFSPSLIPEPILGFLTIFLIPLQVLLVIAALDGFSQKWQVEVEVQDTTSGAAKNRTPSLNGKAARASASFSPEGSES